MESHGEPNQTCFSIFYVIDIKECNDPSLHNCDKNADCFETPGSFECICKAGFEARGATCIGM